MIIVVKVKLNDGDAYDNLNVEWRLDWRVIENKPIKEWKTAEDEDEHLETAVGHEPQQKV